MFLSFFYVFQLQSLFRASVINYFKTEHNTKKKLNDEIPGGIAEFITQTYHIFHL